MATGTAYCFLIDKKLILNALFFFKYKAVSEPQDGIIECELKHTSLKIPFFRSRKSSPKELTDFKKYARLHL